MERSTGIRDGLNQKIADIKMHAASDVVNASPADSLVVSRLDEALEIIVAHRERSCTSKGNHRAHGLLRRTLSSLQRGDEFPDDIHHLRPTFGTDRHHGQVVGMRNLTGLVEEFRLQ